MSSYKHLTLEEREDLAELHHAGKSMREIALILDRSPSTISRELRRNRGKKRYHPWRAQTLSIIRRRGRVGCGIVAGSEGWKYVEAGLRRYWSPEAIAGRWRMEHAGERGLSASTIYRYIKQGRFGGIRAKSHLRRRGKRRMTRNANYNSIQPDRLIPDWPEEIRARARIGDWEGDTVYGGVGKGYLVTLVDRKSRYLLAGKASTRRPEEIRLVMEQLLAGHEVKSISLDNGSEFAQFRQLEAEINTLVYFAQPHKPWQRGTNENTNDILRFFFPKGFDFLSLPQDFLDYVLSLINARPRKCLNWHSPLECLSCSLCVALP